MKLLVIAVLLFTSVIAVQCLRAELKDIMDQCKKDNNVSEEEDRAFIESSMDKSKATNNIKCSSKCYLEKVKILVDGDLVADALPGYAEKTSIENVQLAVDKCNKESGVDECDDAFQKGFCLHETLHLHRVQ
uniref:Odorant binding protein n=1 Tax=Liriomyza trifolii TaxID=198433 RepID=A0A2Z4SVB1_LIRTR|nr:odorant binding protein [Liriomyza trifolii]